MSACLEWFPSDTLTSNLWLRLSKSVLPRPQGESTVEKGCLVPWLHSDTNLFWLLVQAGHSHQITPNLLLISSAPENWLSTRISQVPHLVANTSDLLERGHPDLACCRFEISLTGLEAFTNDDRERSFLALSVGKGRQQVKPSILHVPLSIFLCFSQALIKSGDTT